MPSSSVSKRDRWLGGAFVLTTIGLQILWIGLPALLLSFLLVVSFGVWLAGRWRVRTGLRTAYGLGVLALVAHGAEEFIGGFHTAAPQMLGLSPVPGGRFLVFLGVWFLLFGAAAVTVRPGRALPVLIILFFVIAGGVGNGIAHLLLVVQQGAYFPGAWTAPVLLLLGLWVLRLLYGPDRVPSH